MNRTETGGQIVSIPVAEHLELALSELSSCSRSDAISQAKAILADESDKTQAWMMEHINEVTGWDVSVRLTAVTDVVVKALSRRAFKDAPQALWSEVGIFAIGGYGRGELNPKSDLDVMVVHKSNAVPDWLQNAYNELNTLLWDTGFKVGIAIRGINELDHLIKDDFVTATAILEHRILLGDGSVDQAMLDLLGKFRKKRSKAFLKYKIEELMERRNKAGASLFLMEPNLKTNPGCLRDVQLLYNISFIVFGGRNLYALKELSAVNVEDIKALFQANAHLLRMRSLQHFFHQKRQDVLELKDQVRIAEELGYTGYSRLSAVEVMMKDHYHMVMRVHKMVELLISHLRMQGHLGKKISLIRTRRVLNKYFTAVAGLIYGSSKEIWKEEHAACLVMEMFAIAHKRNLRVSLELQRHIRANLHVLQEDSYTRNDPQIASLFMSILKDVGRIQITLEEMHNCGFLGAYMPEFSNISCLMQFNSYHQYTVDQHTLFAIGYLDQVHRGNDPGLPRMQDVFRRIQRKDLLVIGLLLHDVGKYMGRGHVQRGAMMVGPIAKRMHFTQEEEDIVYFLVEQHVSLSDASRMRDISDVQFIENFAAVVGTQDRLDMLYCLTYADAKATSDKVLTGWQMSVLYELYKNISEYLSNQSLPSVVGKRNRVIHILKERGINEEQIEAFLKDLPYQYAFSIVPNEALHHFDLCQLAEQGNLGFRKEILEDTATIEIAMRWKADRFANVTGALAGMGCGIIDARCWSQGNRVVLYRFQVEHSVPNKLKDDEWWARVIKQLHAVMDGSCDIDALLAQRLQNMMYEDRAADSGFNDPAVKIEQKTSDNYSIIDVHHKDEPGSLSRIARVITNSGCIVDYATVSTMGDISTGVFYVAKSEKKLNNDDASLLQTAIAEELNVI